MKDNSRYVARKLFLPLVVLLWLTSLNCGKNSFQTAEKADASEEAAKALEDKNPQKAITVLLKALGAGFSGVYYNMAALETDAISSQMNAQVLSLIASGQKNTSAMVSILASAHAQKFGIDPFDIALLLVKDSSANEEEDEESEEDSQASMIAALYPVLPEPTNANKQGLNQAIAILNAINEGDRTKADYFKKSLFLMANMSLITKTLDTNPQDGKISILEAQNLQSGDATELFNVIDLALEAVLNSSGDDPETASTIAAIKEKLNSEEGEDNTEKARNFIAANSDKL